MKPRLVLTGRTFYIDNPYLPLGLREDYIRQYPFWAFKACVLVTKEKAYEYRVVTMAQNKSLTQAQD
jgi:hypothetical protein